jgi:uncharacterized protein (DUF305 family)
LAVRTSLAIAMLVAAGGTLRAQTADTVPAPRTPAEQARQEIEHPRFTTAGVHFASTMIGHHAQAIEIAGWAPSHDASPAVQDLCARIAVSQTDEIRFMQTWLQERHQVVPPADPHGYVMPGMDHPMLMPGMLTAAQLTELDAAHGARFDRLLLTDMIRHHQGAIDMVQQLMAAAPQEDPALITYATNVAADQAAEIARMQRLLATISGDTSAR